MSTHRCKIVYLPLDAILTAFGNWKHREVVSLPLIKGLPDGYAIARAQYDFQTNSIAMVVEHPSFPEVEEFGRIPELHSAFAECETVDLRDKAPWIDPASLEGKSYKEARETLVAAEKKSWEFLGKP